jgi:hypothetical protein
VALAAVEVGITGADGGIGVRAYTQLLSHVRVMLEEIDRLATPGSISRPEWAVRSAEMTDSVFKVVLLPRTLPRRRDPDSLSVPPMALVEGVRSLANLPEIPHLFSEPVVSHVEDASVRENARRAVLPASVAWSSVVGVLDVISARREKRRVGLLTDQGRAVLCNVQNVPRDQLFDAFEKKVVAAGSLRRNSRGQPVRLDVESLDVLPPIGPLVSARDLLGAARGVFEPLSSEEFMAVLRDR